MCFEGVLYLPYIARGRIISRLDLDLFGYIISIYEEYDIYHIRIDPSLTLRFFLLPCGACRPESSTVGYDLMSWGTSDGAAHVFFYGYWGHTPHTRGAFYSRYI